MDRNRNVLLRVLLDQVVAFVQKREVIHVN